MKLEINDLTLLRHVKIMFIAEALRQGEEKFLDKKDLLNTEGKRNFLIKEFWKLIKEIDEYLKTK